MKLSKSRSHALLVAVAPVALVAAIAAMSSTAPATGDVAADQGHATSPIPLVGLP